MLISLSLTLFICVLYFSTADIHYKKGQIDYANNIIKYKLQENENGEMIWTEKDIKEK
jgi:hypothetical protein